MEHAPAVTYPTQQFPTLAQATCPCGWQGPPRVIERPGPRELLDLDIRQHRRDSTPWPGKDPTDATGSRQTGPPVSPPPAPAPAAAANTAPPTVEGAPCLAPTATTSSPVTTTT